MIKRKLYLICIHTSKQLGIPFPWDCRRLSRQILTELNIAQLQVIANDLHTEIEGISQDRDPAIFNTFFKIRVYYIFF